LARATWHIDSDNQMFSTIQNMYNPVPLSGAHVFLALCIAIDGYRGLYLPQGKERRIHHQQHKGILGY
jgi:hypothetical protein